MASVLEELSTNISTLSMLKNRNEKDKTIAKLIDELSVLLLERSIVKLKAEIDFPAEVAQLMKDGHNKIECIKKYREVVQSGLCEAKVAVEKYAVDNNCEWTGYNGACEHRF